MIHPGGSRVHWYQFAGEGAGLGGTEVQRGHRPLNLDAGLLDRFRGLPCQIGGDVIDPFGEQYRSPVQDCGAFVRGQWRLPHGRLRDLDGGVDVRRAE